MYTEIWCEADPLEGYELAWKGVLAAVPEPGDTFINLEFKGIYQWKVSPDGRTWDFEPELGAVGVLVYCKPEEE